MKIYQKRLNVYDIIFIQIFCSSIAVNRSEPKYIIDALNLNFKSLIKIKFANEREKKQANM